VNDRGRIGRLSLTILAIAVPAAFLVAGCAEIGFPAVHDMPAPRADTTMTPDQVKQATDDLVSERDRLNTGSVPNAQAAAPNNAAAAKKATAAKAAAAKAAAAKAAAVKAPAAAQNAAPAAAPDAAVTAGAYAKP
jgi:hypothetical protein